MTQLIDYTYRFRLYPTVKQDAQLTKHFGCIRWVYNHFLGAHIKAYEAVQNGFENKKLISYHDDAKALTVLKQQAKTKWLNEANSQSLQQSLKHLIVGFKRFFQHKSKFPKFKSKNKRQSFHVPQHIRIETNKLFIVKFVDGIKINIHRPIDGVIKNATISKNKAGEYFACLGVERHIKPLPKSENQIGIDLGIKTLAVCSDETNFLNITPYKTLEKKRRVFAKGLSRAIKGSKGREKARQRLAKLDNHIRNIRQDHLHKISHHIVSKNQTIVMEDLNVSGMMKNRKLSKSIWDCSFSELVRQISYKAKWYGREFLQINRWFPSSRTCGNCDRINHGLKLNDRKWTCLNCGFVHKRDLNAARNILKQGLALQRTVGITELAVCPDIRLLVKEAIGWNGSPAIRAG